MAVPLPRNSPVPMAPPIAIMESCPVDNPRWSPFRRHHQQAQHGADRQQCQNGGREPPVGAGGFYLALQTEALADDVREARRSEEHTSELQSLRHLVCRLLL